MDETYYTLESIAAHTGLHPRHLTRKDGPIERILQLYPNKRLSPDGEQLNDEGLFLLDEYLRCCGTVGVSGGRKRPLMTYEEWRNYMSTEYESIPSETVAIEVSKTDELTPVEVMNPNDIFAAFDSALEAKGAAVATRLRRSFRKNVTAKIGQELNEEAQAMKGLLDVISGLS